MEYKEINEEFEDWKQTWQESEFLNKIIEKRKERDFREGYMRGFEMALKAAEKVSRVEVIQHSPPYNGRAYTNRFATEVELQYQDQGKTLKIFCK